MDQGINKGAILIVDDSADDAQLLVRALNKLRAERTVIVLNGGSAAIDYLVGRNEYADREKYPAPAILFVDLRMPPPDGFDVLAFLSSQPQLRRPLTVVLSGLLHAKEIQRAYELGAHTYLAKPIQPEDLRNLVAFFGRYWRTSPVTR
ncbi:MAG TPA: response regulator [Methylomirabilota bacterium]|nr:response regulator [Methylomirabilota bacterium]